MAEEKDKKIEEKDIVGLKYFDQLGELLQQLHDVGCERDRADNRTLSYGSVLHADSALYVQSGRHITARPAAGQ